MTLYLPSGYVDFPAIYSRGFTWNWLTGGRAIGKTFGCLEEHLHINPRIFLYIRRTAKQYQAIKSKDFSPLNPIAKMYNEEYKYEDVPHEDLTRIYRVLGDDKKELVGYMSALSTFYNVRGLNADVVRDIIYDEFVPEPHARPIKKECFALLNLYETVNRNRELQGELPVRFTGLSNSDSLANPYFIDLGLMKYYGRMIETGREVTDLRDRDTLLINFKNSPISIQKKETALYRMAGEKSEYAKMAIENEFNNDDFAYIQSYNLKPFTPVCAIGNIGIFCNRDNSLFYVTSTIPKSVKCYQAFGAEERQFRARFAFLKMAYLNGKVRFETYTEKVAFEAFFDFVQR